MYLSPRQRRRRRGKWGHVTCIGANRAFAPKSGHTHTGAMLRRYAHGPGVDEPIVWYEGAGLSNRHYLVADERGSVIALANDAALATQINVYDEYGVSGNGDMYRAMSRSATIRSGAWWRRLAVA
jgi:hypothetical protein